LGSEEKEVYEIIASLPIDLKRISVLSDITFEAQLLMRSRFIKKITLNYDDFQKLHEYSNDKDILLTTELDNKRFIIYIEKGKIVSAAMSDPGKGERTVGLKPLASLILASKIQPIVFKLFEIQPMVEEDVTREAPRRAVGDEVVQQAVEKRVEKPESVEKPIVVQFAEKLAEFKNKAYKIISDTALAYGCRVADFKLNVSRGLINITISVRKKSVLGKCDIDSLKNVLENDLNLLLVMYDISLPFKIDIVFVK